MASSESRAASDGEPLSAPYTLVLTHDVDRLSMRNLPLLSRARLSFTKDLVFRSLRRLVLGRLSVRDYVESLGMALRLPFVAIGLARDPWERSIELITGIEEEFGARSTFFFMAFERQAGHSSPGRPAPATRASHYRVSSHSDLVRSLVARGWEAGVYGIDCHISPEAAAAEKAELTGIVGAEYSLGVRMHWLYSSPELRRNLAQAGFAYDSTLGSNDSIGFPRADEELERARSRLGAGRQRSSSSPAYRPFDDSETGLAVLPLNIQDVALLREDHMGLEGEDAWQAIEAVLDEAKQHRAVVTVSWHNDSFLPPRCWAALYRRLLEQARKDGAVIERAVDVVSERTRSRNRCA